PAERLDRADLQQRWRCSRATIERRQRDGTLPAPLFLGQRRLWSVLDVEAAEQRLHAAHEATLSGVAGVAAARPAAARLAEARELEQLEAAAAAFAAHRGLAAAARVVQRFTVDSKPSSIPKKHRAAALRALTSKEHSK